MLACLGAIVVMGQERTVENRPYTDLRKFHFGILVGTHLQDLEFNNVGPQMISNTDGTQQQYVVTADQDRWDDGFNVGVLGELRINRTFSASHRTCDVFRFATYLVSQHGYICSRLYVVA